MMHVLKCNDRRIKDIWKCVCHGLQFGGKGNKVTTGPSDVSLNSIFLTVYSECWTEWHIIWCHNLGNSLLLMK